MEFRSKDFRKRIRVTQYQLAELLGCDQSLVAAWERGKFPTYEKICKLVELGITIQELLGDEIANRLISNSSIPFEKRPALFDDKEFGGGVAEQLDEMKIRGIIKNEVQKELQDMKQKGLL